MAGRADAAAARTSHTRSAASFLKAGISCEFTSSCGSLGASLGSPKTTSCKPHSAHLTTLQNCNSA